MYQHTESTDFQHFPLLRDSCSPSRQFVLANGMLKGKSRFVVAPVIHNVAEDAGDTHLLDGKLEDSDDDGDGKGTNVEGYEMRERTYTGASEHTENSFSGIGMFPVISDAGEYVKMIINDWSHTNFSGHEAYQLFHSINYVEL